MFNHVSLFLCHVSIIVFIYDYDYDYDYECKGVRFNASLSCDDRITVYRHLVWLTIIMYKECRDSMMLISVCRIYCDTGRSQNKT